ncbi:MAG: hypothetical protein JWO59_3419 [Chloroflexi bacterium]|nr:hypothetical protein [Chloroflexota bacterium]
MPAVQPSMLAEQRQKQFLTYITERRSAQVSELSIRFGVSNSTVRRDLQELEERELVRRVHGGALLLTERSLPQEAEIGQRGPHRAEVKQRIAQAAAALVRDGSTIIVTGGTTTEAMIPYLADKVGLTVITNGLNIANRLVPYSAIDVAILGGWLRHAELTMLGHLTTQALQDLRADQIFYGIFGIDMDQGLTGTYIREVQTDRTLIAAARELVVLADSSKFSQSGPARVLPIDAISTLVTDVDAPAESLQTLRDRGVTVVQA